MKKYGLYFIFGLLSALFTAFQAEAYWNNNDDNNVAQDTNGRTYRREGNIIYTNDGRVFYQSGNTITGSDGSHWQQSGNTYYKDGKPQCRETGGRIFCDN